MSSTIKNPVVFYRSLTTKSGEFKTGSFCLVVELHQEGSAINGVAPSSLGSVVTVSRQGAAEWRIAAIFYVICSHSDCVLLNIQFWVEIVVGWADLV